MQSRRRDGSISERGPGKWLLRTYLGCGPNGKRQYTSKVFTGTKMEARRELNELLLAKEEKTFVPASRLTLGEYLQEWIAGKIDVAPRTRVS